MDKLVGIEVRLKTSRSQEEEQVHVYITLTEARRAVRLARFSMVSCRTVREGKLTALLVFHQVQKQNKTTRNVSLVVDWKQNEVKQRLNCLRTCLCPSRLMNCLVCVQQHTGHLRKMRRGYRVVQEAKNRSGPSPSTEPVRRYGCLAAVTY